MVASWKVRCGMALVAVLLALGAGEAGLRLLGVSFPSFYELDPYRGRAHRPGAHGWYAREGRADVHINADGMRDRERAVAKPAGTFRVALLGDSFVQAVQVDLDSTMGAVLERRLSGGMGRDIEVLNFGVASYGTAQEFLTLRHRVWKYAPDVVVLAVFTGNDIQDNSRVLSRVPLRPYFDLDHGFLRLDASFRRLPEYRRQGTRRAALRRAAVQNSHLVQLLCEVAHRRGMAERGMNHADLTDAVYAPPADADWEAAWRVTEELVRRMHRECGRRSVPFVLATLSNPIQVHPEAAVRRAHAARLGVADLFYAERRFEALGRQEGFPVVTLAPRLQLWAEAHGSCVHGFEDAVPCGGHWNTTGQRLAGDMLAAALVPVLDRR